jgi:hypothetical protein
MSAATVSGAVAFVWRVVNETWAVEAPEKAVEGTPSFAASHAAPLDHVDIDERMVTNGRRNRNSHSTRVENACSQVIYNNAASGLERGK